MEPGIDLAKRSEDGCWGKPAVVVTVAICTAFFLTKTEFRTLGQGYNSVVKCLPSVYKALVQSLAL